MSEACSTHNRLTTWPLMSRPRMLPAWVRTSSALSASLTPPALPRPPTFTWALTTTGYPDSSACATAWSTVSATPPLEMGMPNRAKYCLPWYSKRSTGSVPLCLLGWFWFRLSTTAFRGDGGHERTAPDRAGRPPTPGIGSAGAVRRRQATPDVGPTHGRDSGVLAGLPFVECLAEPGTDGRKGGPGREDLGHAHLLEHGDVALGDDASDQDQHVVPALRPQPVDHPGNEGQVGPGEEGESDGVGILLDDGLDHLIGRLVQSRVDDLESGVAQRPGDDFGAPIVPVEAGLVDYHSIRALHGGRY